MYSSLSAEDIDFGSTYEIHQGLMSFIWGPGINIAILLVLYSYRKYYIYLHVLCGLFATVFSLATSIPILLTTGIVTSDRAGYKIHIHFIVGIASISVIALQAILGIAIRLLNICDFSTSSLIKIKYAHIVLGYIVSILVKSNMYIIYGLDNPKFWIFLGQDLLFAILIITRKIYFPQMKKITIPKNIQKDLNKLSAYHSLKDLDEEKGYCVFSNIIYSLQPMKINHPGGYRIIESVKNRDVDRFIYGMYGSQAIPQISPHSHSFKSLQLLGKPVGYVNIRSCYNGFDDEIGYVELAIKQINSVSAKGRIYEVQLKKQSGKFNFNNYEDIIQLGRFYSLTFRSTTRLYTAVNFLSAKNKQLMQKFFKGKIPYQKTMYTSEIYYPPSKNNRNQQDNDYVPVLIKVYPEGQLTERLISHPAEKLRLSHEKGLGLQLQPYFHNNIVIIAGGTGLFPFYDLIDLFFKNQVIKLNEGERQEFIMHEPILKKCSFNQFVIQIFLAVDSIQEIHPIIYRQFVYLLKYSKNFSLILRTKSQLLQPVFTSELLSVGCKIVSQRFEQILDQKWILKEKSKIYICGPPRMNQSLSRYFRERSYSPSSYCFM